MHQLLADALDVASLADAWIETFLALRESAKKAVASLADAWIETRLPRPSRPHTWSRPSRTRGLKRRLHSTQAYEVVASLADAWIETSLTAGIPQGKKSRPSRTRGLKHERKGL